MKGLIRNNFYSVEGNLKIAVAIGIALMICSIVGSILYRNTSILSFVSLAQMVLFVAFPASALQKDITSKWNKFEITMPIKREDVVKARYLSFMLYGLMGIAISVITIMLVNLSGSDINLERVSSSLTTGMLALFVSPALMYPLTLKFGADKSETILVISIFLIMVIYVFCAGAFSPFFAKLNNGEFIFRGASIIVSIIIFIISYFASLNMYKKKEL